MFELALLALGYALWGVLVGLLVGFTAIGTALVGIPGLIVLFGMPPVLAVGTIAAAGFIMMLSGAMQHYRHGNVVPSVALAFVVTSVPAAYLTARFAADIDAVFPLENTLAIVIVISVIVLFHRYVILRPEPRVLELPRWKLYLAPVLGLILGALMGATSISGSIIVIAFIMLLKLPSPEAVGTTTAVSMISLAVATVAHVSQANVDPAALAGLIPGMALGAALGARNVKRVPRQLLRIAILVILLVAAVVILWQ